MPWGRRPPRRPNGNGGEPSSSPPRCRDGGRGAGLDGTDSLVGLSMSAPRTESMEPESAPHTARPSWRSSSALDGRRADVARRRASDRFRTPRRCHRTSSRRSGARDSVVGNARAYLARFLAVLNGLFGQNPAGWQEGSREPAPRRSSSRARTARRRRMPARAAAFPPGMARCKCVSIIAGSARGYVPGRSRQPAAIENWN